MFKELEPEKIETLTNLLKQKYDEFTPEVISSIQSLGKGITFKDFVAYLLYMEDHSELLEGADDYIESNYVAVCACIFPYDELIDGFSKIDNYSMIPSFIDFKKEHGIESDYKVDYDKIVNECIERNKRYEFNGLYSKVYSYISDETKKKVYNYFLENTKELTIYDSYIDGFIDILKYGHKNNLDLSKLTSMVSPAVLIKLSVTDEDEVIQAIYEGLDDDGKNLITNFKELKDSPEITPEIFERVFETTLEHEYRLEIVKYAVKKGYIPPIETFQESYYVDDEVKGILSNTNLAYYLMTKISFHSKHSDDLIEKEITSPEMKTAFKTLRQYEPGFGYCELFREIGDLLSKENITKYFDENGMKFEFMQEVVKRNLNQTSFSLNNNFLLFTLEQGIEKASKEDYVYYDFIYTLTKLYSSGYRFFYGHDIRDVVKDKNEFFEILADQNQLTAFLKENSRNKEVIFALMKINAINEEIAKDIISPKEMIGLNVIKEILDNKIFDNDLFTTLYTSEQFYNEKGLNKDELIKHLIENAKTDVLLSLSEKYVSKQQQEFFKVFLPMFENEEKRKDNNYDFIISTIINPNEINEYMVNNQPTKKLIDKFFELGYLKCIKGYESLLNDKQKVIYEVYQSIDADELKEVYNDFIGNSIKDIYSGAFSEEAIRAIPDLLNQIKLSNSSEIAGRYVNIAKLILQSAGKENKDPIKQFRKIEKIFLTRELSHMDKIFKSFQLLYPHEKLIETIREKKTQISPTLYKYATSPEETILGKEALRLYGDCTYAVEMVMYADLLKTTIASNDKTFIDYIDGIEKGNQIFSRLMNNETNIASLTSEEKYVLNTYVYHLEKLYNKTHRANPIKLTNDLEKSLSLLIPLYKSVDTALIPDQIIKNNYYTYLGISTMKELKDIMDQAKKDANSKGYEYAKRTMVIEKGDLVKGIGDIAYFDVIIQNGSVSKEFLGGDIGSDLTPFDTDLSIVPETKDSNHASTTDLEASSYGPIFFVIKDAINKYNCTRREKETVDIEETSETFRNIEIFRTLGNTHYGIRTGFPTTQVDYIYCTDIYDFRVDKIGLVLAKNGIYIPVVDKEGKLLFTPENYEHLRNKMAGLSYYGINQFDVAPTVQNDYTLTLASQISENIIETRKIKQQLEEKLRIGFAESGLVMKTQIDGDLQPGTVELIDTGSTGRGTNQIGDGDFDFMVRLDKIINRDSSKVAEVTERVCTALGISSQTGDLRKAKIPLGDSEVELDISYVNKSDKITYTTDMSLTDRLETIRKQDPEKHLMVLANIVLAKKLLKLGECYKPHHAGENPQGGLGGVGTENWILQNGGSLEEAATEFLIAAGVMKIETTETGKQIVIDETAQKEYNEFKNTYSVWDFGQNQMAEKRYRDFPHDNFVYNNMNSTGYGKMVKAMQIYMMELHPDIKFIPKPVTVEEQQKQEESASKIRGLLQGLKQETYTEQPSLVEEKGK